MKLSQAIRIARNDRQMSQTALIERGVPCTQSMLSMMEKGERRIPKDLRHIIAEKLNHAAVYAGAMLESTGGVGPLYLDGPNVDRYRASVHLKLMEELEEAAKSARDFPTYKPPASMTDRDMAQLREHLMQVLDVFVCSFNYAAVMCDDYGMSFKQLFSDHHNKLRGKGYAIS